MQVPTASGTVGLTIGAGATALMLTAAETTILAAGILLAKAAVVLPPKASLVGGLVGGLVGCLLGWLGGKGNGSKAPLSDPSLICSALQNQEEGLKH